MSNNLSEVLFKRTHGAVETSELITRKSEVPQLLEGAWYRVLNRLEWAWQGVNPVDSSFILSRIAANHAERSHSNWLDTVIGYHRGNWSYEWCRIGALSQKKAIKLNDSAELSKDWFNASRFYSIASYPHFKGDRLSFQSMTLAYNAYRQIERRSLLKELSFPYQNGTIKAILHLPNESTKPFPVVFVCGGLENLSLDYYRLFNRYFRPAGFAMLIMNIPGVSEHERWKLTQSSSDLHQYVLSQLHTVSWIDHNNVALMGLKFGAHIATRLAYINPYKIKALICVAPAVHQIFIEDLFVNKLPIMYKDLIISRLGFTDVSDARLNAELLSFSLKKQGLLGRPVPVPLFLISFTKGMLKQAYKDIELLKSSSYRCQHISTTPAFLSQNKNEALLKMSAWLSNIFH